MGINRAKPAVGSPGNSPSKLMKNCQKEDKSPICYGASSFIQKLFFDNAS